MSKKVFAIILLVFLCVACGKDDTVDTAQSSSQNAAAVTVEKETVDIYPPATTSVWIEGGYTGGDEYYDDYECDPDVEDCNEEYSDYDSSDMGEEVAQGDATYQDSPNPVVIYFSSNNGICPISLDINQDEISPYAKISPDIKGLWYWTDDCTLDFAPESDWDAGKEYSITFDKAMFNPLYNMPSLKHKFKTQQFSASLQQFSVYQAMTETGEFTEPYGSATIYFTHQVNRDSLEKNLSITHNGKKINRTILYDTVGRYAFIKTDAIKLGEKTGILKLSLDSVTTTQGGEGLSEKLSSSVDVPSMSEFFKVNKVSPFIVRNAAGEPEQTVTFDFTLPVSLNELKGNVVVYELPFKYKDSNRYNWSDNFATMTPEELSKLKKIELNFMEETGSANIQAAKFFQTNINSYLGIVVKKGLKSKNGYILSENYSRVYEVPRFPRELKFTQSGRLLTLGGDKMLSFFSRGIGNVRLEVARVQSDRLNHLISQTYSLANANFENYSFNEYDISTVYTKDISLNNSDPAKVNYFSFDMSPYLEKQGTAGVFVLKVYDNNSNSRYEVDRRLIQVSDIGLLMKSDAKGVRTIFAISLRTGVPIVGASVYSLARNGSKVSATQTDLNGSATLPVRKGSREMEEVAIVVENGRDYSFMSSRNNAYTAVDFSRFDTGGEYLSNSSNDSGITLKSYLFTERGIYRPGDIVHIGAIVKQTDWKSLSGIPMEVVITDPRGNQVLKKAFTLDDSGLSELEYQTDYTSSTGVYGMSINVLSSQTDLTNVRNIRLGATSFKVEEFKPDTMKISARIVGEPSKGWLSMDGLMLETSLNNLFGIPAQKHDIRWLYQLTPATFRFKEYKEYTFNDPYRDNAAARHIGAVELPAGVTDEKGIATVNLDLEKYAGGLYNITAQVEGFGSGTGDSVLVNVSRLVSPMKHLVGHKSNIKKYLRKDEVANIQLIAIDPDLNQIDLSGLSFNVVEKRYLSLLIRQRDGSYAYQSVLRERVVNAGKYAISKAGEAFALPTENPGTFQVQIKDQNDLMLAKIDYFVSGTGNLTVSLEKNAELDIKLNKAEYSNGEEIELNIISPYVGTGLITIELDKVYTSKWFTTTSTSTKQTIRVPNSIEGNGYVSVSFMRDPASVDVYTSPYSYAVVPFNINKGKHTIDIGLTAAEEARPGKPLPITFNANKSGRVVVFAVDEGILQVANYNTPKPINDFFRKKALQTYTQEIVSLLLSDNKAILEAAGVGGDYSMMDMAAKALAANLNPFKRKTELPIVYWSGVMDVEAGVNNTVKYNVPSYFNGTLRIMAVAVSADSVGSTDKQVLVRAPIVVQPSMPVSFAPTDKAGVSVVVANAIPGSKTDTPIEVTISTDEYFEVVGDKKKVINLSENREGRVEFEIKANSKLGSGTVTFEAVATSVADSKVSINATASVRPATLYTTVLTTGISDRKDVVIKDFAHDMYPEFASRSVSASHNPLLIARGLSKYLEKYPHGCTEQITSQSFPGIYIRGSFVTEKDAQESFQKAISILRKRQQPNGGFSLWDGGWRVTHTYATVYAMHFLTDAKEQGYNVPVDIMENGLKWLKSYTTINSNNRITSLYDAQLKAYAAYVLTRNGVVTTAFMANLEEALNKDYSKEWKSAVISTYMAAIYKMLQMDAKAMETLKGFVPDVKERFFFYSDFDTSTLRNTTYLYIIGKHFPQEIGKVDTKTVTNLMDSVADMHYSSLSSSYSILALYALASATKGEDDSMKILMDTVTEKAKELNYTPLPYPNATFAKDVKKLTAETEKAGKLGFFIVATQQGFNTAMPDKEMNGLEVVKEYLDKNGSVKTTFVQGDDVIVRIKIRSNGSMKNIENVALVDLLPSALEVPSDAVAEIQRKGYSGQYSSRVFDYADVREDRVVFYLPVSTSLKEITYRAKVVSKGDFVLPPVYASAMYDPAYRGNSASGRMVVSER